MVGVVMMCIFAAIMCELAVIVYLEASQPAPSVEIDRLRVENVRLREIAEVAVATAAMATTKAMGGTPDLFAPDGGWDAYDQRVERIEAAVNRVSR